MVRERQDCDKPEIPDVGRQLRAWRRHQKLKQGELEARAGLSHNAVSRIETGAVSPKLETLDRLAEALQISVEELQFRTPNAGACDEPTGYLDSVVQRISQLPTDKQRRLLDAISPLIDLVDGGS